MKTLNFVLHAHIPYVLNSEIEYWLHEVVLDTYLPLLKILDKNKNKSFCITINISPTILMQITDSSFIQNFLNYTELRKKILSVNIDSIEKQKILRDDLDDLESLLLFFKKWNHNLIDIFSYFQKTGSLNITTSAITHAYLPLLVSYPHLLNLQISLGVILSNEYFHNISGFWSPECGVFPQLSDFLIHNNIDYTFADPYSISYSSLKDSPVYIYNDIVYFCRDYKTTAKIWDSQRGYPCSEYYRDFHQDIKSESLIVQQLLKESGVPVSNVSLYRVTDRNSQLKKIFCKEKVYQQIQEDVKDFNTYLHTRFQSQDIITICFDAELFGHWWKDGISFLDAFLSENHPFNISFTKPVSIPEITPITSSWGKNNNAESWINKKTQKLWEQIVIKNHQMEQNFRNNTGNSDVLYDLLMLQASDWLFLITYDSYTNLSKEIITDFLCNNKSNRFLKNQWLFQKIL